MVELGRHVKAKLRLMVKSFLLYVVGLSMKLLFRVLSFSFFLHSHASRNSDCPHSEQKRKGSLASDATELGLHLNVKPLNNSLFSRDS